MKNTACEIEAGGQSVRYHFRRTSHERALIFSNRPAHPKHRKPSEEAVPDPIRCSTTTFAHDRLIVEKRHGYIRFRGNQLTGLGRVRQFEA